MIPPLHLFCQNAVHHVVLPDAVLPGIVLPIEQLCHKPFLHQGPLLLNLLCQGILDRIQAVILILYKYQLIPTPVLTVFIVLLHILSQPVYWLVIMVGHVDCHKASQD